jgi:hypothetical protein
MPDFQLDYERSMQYGGRFPGLRVSLQKHADFHGKSPAGDAAADFNLLDLVLPGSVDGRCPSLDFLIWAASYNSTRCVRIRVRSPWKACLIAPGMVSSLPGFPCWKLALQILHAFTNP